MSRCSDLLGQPKSLLQCCSYMKKFTQNKTKAAKAGLWDQACSGMVAGSLTKAMTLLSWVIKCMLSPNPIVGLEAQESLWMSTGSSLPHGLLPAFRVPLSDPRGCSCYSGLQFWSPVLIPLFQGHALGLTVAQFYHHLPVTVMGQPTQTSGLPGWLTMAFECQADSNGHLVFLIWHEHVELLCSNSPYLLLKIQLLIHFCSFFFLNFLLLLNFYLLNLLVWH